MNKNIKNELFIGIPNEIMNTKHNLHYELLNFKTNMELKVFLTVLAKATMIFKANKSTEQQTFSTVGFLSDDSFLPKNLTLKKLTNIIENMNSPFFEHLEINHKTVCFKLSNEYTKSVLKKGFSKINLMSLKHHKDLKTTKLAVLTMMKPNGYLSLNYLFKALKVNPNLPRTGRIREIKKAFKKLDFLEWEYKHPVNKNVEVLAGHYKFHYLQKPEEYSAEYFDEETEKVPEVAQEQEPEEQLELDELALKDIYLSITEDHENNEYSDEIPF